MPKTVTSSRGILIPRDPSVSPSSLLSTRNTSRLNANVTNANHGPCTRSAGNPISTLNTMQVNPAMAIASEERHVRKRRAHPADGDLATRVEQDRDVGPDPEEPRLGQGDLAGEAVDEVRPDADDAEDREQAQVEQRRSRAPDGEHDEECETSGQRRPLDDDPGPRIQRHQQVEADDADECQRPQPHDPREVGSSEREASRPARSPRWRRRRVATRPLPARPP